MIKKILLTAMTAMAVTGSANAGIVYMTGTSNPWNNLTNDAAMNAAFGAGSWTKVMGFDASVFSASNSFIFFDGSDDNGNDFASFITANVGALTSFVTAGGSVFSNIASNVGPSTLNLGFGFSTSYPQYSSTGQVTAAGVAAGLNAGMASTSLVGSFFSHNSISGGTCFVNGQAGCVFAGGAQGAGGYFAGGQTTTNFHGAANDAFQLRVNELKYAASFAGAPGVPEPATWAMMLGGFGLVGGAMRRRQKVSVTYA